MTNLKRHAELFEEPVVRVESGEHGLPDNGPDADIVEAPAGSIILYDARTWHRAGVNRTGEKRAAMLQAITPMYLMPFTDTIGR
ncbi:MAG: hypothetical protein O7E57_00885 [Gammaproteobacteria bacterium]|nr:hypothetical protein [Gammaproteobacteria bacterium]